MNQEKLRQTVQHIVSLLEKKAYGELESLSRGVRLSAEEMREAIEGYGQEIFHLPEAGFKELNVIEVRNSNPKQWGVDVPLYTENEGRSDLTLAITLIESQTALYKIEIDDIHVL